MKREIGSRWKGTASVMAEEKKSLGAEIIEGLAEFRDALRSGEPLGKKFTVRTIELDLKPRDYDAESVAATRATLKVSQAVFARVLGVSVAMVQAWEQGHRKPSPMACRLLDEINRDREHWILLLQKAIKRKRPLQAK